MTGPDQTQRPAPSGEEKHWLDNTQNIDKVFWGIIVLCVVLMLVEPFYHKHPYFSFEGSFGFYGWFAFIACAGLALVARAIGKILRRSETFYDGDNGNREDNG